MSLLRLLPRELALAAATGLGVGVFAAGTAYGYYVQNGGPTWMGVGVIPISLLIVAALYVGLARRRKPRASDWLALGYTAAIVLAIGLLTVQEALQELAVELNLELF